MLQRKLCVFQETQGDPARVKFGFDAHRVGLGAMLGRGLVGELRIAASSSLRAIARRSAHHSSPSTSTSGSRGAPSSALTASTA